MFFKPYFNYLFSSVHNCEDGFNTRFFNCTNMIFHIFIVITQYFCYLRSLYLLFKVWSAVPIMSTLNRILSTVYMPVIIWLFIVFLGGKFQFQLRRLQFQRHICYFAMIILSVKIQPVLVQTNAMHMPYILPKTERIRSFHY